MKDGLIKLEIGGKERSLKYNMRAVETFSEIRNAGSGSVSASVTLVYAGLIGWLYVKQLEPDFTFADVAEWVEDLILEGKQDVIEQADKCFSDSKAFKYFSEQAGSKKKKKLTGTKSTPTHGGT